VVPDWLVTALGASTCAPDEVLDAELAGASPQTSQYPSTIVPVQPGCAHFIEQHGLSTPET
jgi:hypothetical protein